MLKKNKNYTFLTFFQRKTQFGTRFVIKVMKTKVRDLFS